MTLLVESRDIQHPQITISGLGSIKGVLDEAQTVVKFLNVPFGVLTERWRPADKVRPWQGVRDGTKNGFSPPQATAADPPMSMVFETTSKMSYEEAMSERDCLSLNIYLPASALNSDEKLPVCVWICGGGYKAGSVTSPVYGKKDAKRCVFFSRQIHFVTESVMVSTSIEAKKPIIMVSISYRVNFFGFMSSKELVLDAQTYAKAVPGDQRRWYDASVGNWGILDQVLGLEWVRDHIQAFKGDPGRVTAMGGSVRSMSISHLVLIPACRGLFHRAILQSSAASSLPTMRPEIEGQRYFDYLCQVSKVPADLPPLEKVALLRAVPEKALAEIMNSADINLFSPTLDGVLFNGDSRLVIGDASLYDPNLNWVVMGACANEGNISLNGGVRTTLETCTNSQSEIANGLAVIYISTFLGSIFPATFNASTPENVARLKARLCAPGDGPVFDRIFGVPKSDAEATEISARLLGNGPFNFPVLQASEALLVHPTCRLTRYHFDVQVQRTNKMLPGLKANHASELYFTLGNKTLLAMLSEDERLFVRKVQEVWIEFITAKSPEESHLPKVSNILPTSTSEEAIVFGADLKVGRGAVERMPAEEVEFWRRSFTYAAQQAQLGRGVEVGFDTFKAS